MSDSSNLDDDVRKAEASRRVAKLFGWDTAETEEAADDGVRFRDATGNQILKFILQDMGTPEPLPKLPPKPRIASTSQLKELIREMEVIKPLTWLNPAWWRSLFTSYGSTRFCWNGCGNLKDYWHFRIMKLRLKD